MLDVSALRKNMRVYAKVLFMGFAAGKGPPLNLETPAL